VVQALEEWASREAASIMVGLFVVAAVVTAVAVLPSLALGGGPGSRARMLGRGPAPTDATHAIGPTGSSPAGGRDADGLEPPEPGLAL
jgi:uncharacterized RDD family membrane protein YckC